MGQRNAYRRFVGNSVGNKPPGRPRHRRVDNIKMGLRWDGVVRTGFLWFGNQCWALVNNVILPSNMNLSVANLRALSLYYHTDTNAY
jgi:hypothetical protein